MTGNRLVENLEEIRPDILVLDMTLPDLDAHETFTTLSARKLRPYVVATAPRHNPHLSGIQRYPAVRGALPRVLALSPLLRHVLAGVAQGCRYFAASPAVDPFYSGLSTDETLELALMVIGLDTFDLMRELGWSIHKVYNTQRRLRKKLDVDTSGQAITLGIRQGLVGVLTEPREHLSLKESA
jgi:DNA-binding CsgD family transcriptional regulator